MSLVRGKRSTWQYHVVFFETLIDYCICDPLNEDSVFFLDTLD